MRFVVLVGAALAFAGAMACAWGQVVYPAPLSGAAEVPPNASPGVGSVTIRYFPATSMMTVTTSFAGLSSVATAAHIHCCTIGVGTTNAGLATQTPSFTGFPAGVMAGNYQQTFDMTFASSFNPSFVSASGSVATALQRLVEGMGNGTAYFDIHSAAFPGGELRGNLFEQGLFRSDFD